MTAGEKIAQKRKELSLSQEALGEKLGLSRQAIYKWESDAALPEIDKLVALSKLFGVSVGWLLGAEEPATGRARKGTQAGSSRKRSCSWWRRSPPGIWQPSPSRPPNKRGADFSRPSWR